MPSGSDVKKRNLSFRAGFEPSAYSDLVGDKAMDSGPSGPLIVPTRSVDRGRAQCGLKSGLYKGGSSDGPRRGSPVRASDGTTFIDGN